MTRIPTLIQRRLQRLQRRQARVRKERTSAPRSSTPLRFDASLRIGGIGALHAEIASATGIVATWSCRKGEVHGGLRHRRRDEDLWVLESPLGEAASIDDHIRWLCHEVLPHKVYFAGVIKQAAWADLWLGCLSESPYPVLSARPESMEMLRDLNLGLVFNLTCV